jgi:cytochrome c5
VRNHDLVFMKRFSMIIAALVVLTVVLILAARALYLSAPTDPNPLAEQRVSERLRPVGAVYAGETGAAAMAAAAEAAAAAAASQVAYDGSLDGGHIYQQLCGACHTNGVAGAPKLEQAAWTARIAQGTDTLIRHAIEGYQGEAGIMPARGGNPALSDAQVEASVRWMLDNLK